MHVKDIVLENMVLQAKKGIDVQEATGITFKNIKVISAETNPVMDLVQSDKLYLIISLIKMVLNYCSGSAAKEAAISLLENTDASKAKKKDQL